MAVDVGGGYGMHKFTSGCDPGLLGARTYYSAGGFNPPVTRDYASSRAPVVYLPTNENPRCSIARTFSSSVPARCSLQRLCSRRTHMGEIDVGGRGYYD